MKKLLISSVVLSAMFLSSVADPHLPVARFAVVFKVASIALLAICAATAHRPQKLLAVALTLSAAGDLFLEVRHLGHWGPVQLFLCGLSFFLGAHLFYLVLFLKNRAEAIAVLRNVMAIVVPIVTIFMLRFLWAGLAEMRIPVIAYSLVLTVMAATALRSRFGTIVATGALFFVASDMMLALSIFGHPFAGARVLVWVTYYAAQVMIAVGVLRTAQSQSEESRFASIGA